jgi:hypothetical protein
MSTLTLHMHTASSIALVSYAAVTNTRCSIALPSAYARAALARPVAQASGAHQPRAVELSLDVRNHLVYRRPPSTRLRLRRRCRPQDMPNTMRE